MEERIKFCPNRAVFLPVATDRMLQTQLTLYSTTSKTRRMMMNEEKYAKDVQEIGRVNQIAVKELCMFKIYKKI